MEDWLLLLSVNLPWRTTTRPISKTTPTSKSRRLLLSLANPQVSPPSIAWERSLQPRRPSNHSSTTTARTITTNQPPTTLRLMERDCIFVRSAPLRWPVTGTASPRSKAGPIYSRRRNKALQATHADRFKSNLNPNQEQERQRSNVSLGSWNICEELSAAPAKQSRTS